MPLTVIKHVNGKSDQVGLKSGKDLVIIASRFNHDIVETLLEGALKTLVASGVPKAQICVFWVPGALEIPGLIATLLESREEYVGYLALGCVIQGETFHHDVVISQSARLIADLTMDARNEHGVGVPIINGILACRNREQALARSQGDGNRGSDYARALIEMHSLYKKISEDFES